MTKERKMTESISLVIPIPMDALDADHSAMRDYFIELFSKHKPELEPSRANIDGSC